RVRVLVSPDGLVDWRAGDLVARVRLRGIGVGAAWQSTHLPRRHPQWLPTLCERTAAEPAWRQQLRLADAHRRDDAPPHCRDRSATDADRARHRRVTDPDRADRWWRCDGAAESGRSTGG